MTTKLGAKKKHGVAWRIFLTLGIISAVWLLVTLWVEYPGPSKRRDIGVPGATNRVLIVFDPDPIYNLDEQVCSAMAAALAAKNTYVTIASTRSTNEINVMGYDAFVLCANTYNWSPDWAMQRFVNEAFALKNKLVVAIVIGSGSTECANRKFTQSIQEHGGILIQQNTWWLMRPNDETQLAQNNMLVACQRAYEKGLMLGDTLLVIEKATDVNHPMP